MSISKNFQISEDARFYILVGDRRTWSVSLSKRVWGFSERAKGAWNTSRTGDYVAFYIKAPQKKIIGFGRFGKKYVDDLIIWPNEKMSEKAIWKYKIKFKPIFVVRNWRQGIPVPKELMLNTGRKVVPRQLFLSLIKEADRKWGTNVHSALDGHSR